MKNIHVLPTDKPSRLYKIGNFLLLDSRVMPNNTLETKNQNIYITNDKEIKEGDWVITSTNDIIQWAKVFQPYGKKIILTTDQDLIKDGVQAIDDDFLQWFVKNPSCEEIKIIDDVECLPMPNIHINKHIYKIIIPKEEPNKTHYLDELPNMDKEVLAKMWESAMPKLEPKQEYEYIGECKGNNDDGCFMNSSGHNCGCYTRKLIKQETLEEAAENYGWRIKRNTFSNAVKAIELVESAKQDFIIGAKWQQERMYSEEEVLVILDKFLTVMIKGEKTGLLEKFLEQFKKK